MEQLQQFFGIHDPSILILYIGLAVVLWAQLRQRGENKRDDITMALATQIGEYAKVSSEINKTLVDFAQKLNTANEHSAALQVQEIERIKKHQEIANVEHDDRVKLAMAQTQQIAATTTLIESVKTGITDAALQNRDHVAKVIGEAHDDLAGQFKDQLGKVVQEVTLAVQDKIDQILNHLDNLAKEFVESNKALSDKLTSSVGELRVEFTHLKNAQNGDPGKTLTIRPDELRASDPLSGVEAPPHLTLAQIKALREEREAKEKQQHEKGDGL